MLSQMDPSDRERVAPLAGAWIEIPAKKPSIVSIIVAPLAGAWIEMSLVFWRQTENWVAPLAGAWIEIETSEHLQ